MGPDRVLVTGSSGLLGAEVLAGLGRAGIPATALVHRRQELTTVGGKPLRTEPLAGATSRVPLVHVEGDLCASALGLSPQVLARVQASTRLILHCGAITQFGRRAEQYEQVNVLGTEHLLDVAASRGARPIPVVHVSTAYVCGDRAGLVREDELEAGQRFSNDYERSKYKAELLVHAARSRGVPAVIVRPSIVVGAERNGAIRDFGNLYVVLKLLTEGKVTTLPADYGALLDLVPIDHLRDVILKVVAQFDACEGMTLHVVGRRPFTLREVSDVLAQYPSFRVPRFVPAENFDRNALSSSERWYYDRIVSLYEPYLRSRAEFSRACVRTVADYSGSGGGKAYLRKLLNYAVRVGYLGRATHQVGTAKRGLALTHGSEDAERIGPAEAAG